ncbi:hypothetical protein HWV62_5710 [Athelia sp. TMB]|nr:hypothetical protein HWV62_5710 [Athelia sp. TMB]
MTKFRPRRVKSTVFPSITSDYIAPSTVKKNRSTISKEAADGLKKRRDHLSTQTAAVRAQASALAINNGAPPDTDIPMVFYDDGDGNWVDMGGDGDSDSDENPEISHGGGEREDRARAIFETITMPDHVRRRRKIYIETRRARLRALYASWDAQMPQLVRAFLTWRHGASESDSDPEAMDTTSESESGSVFHVTAIGIMTRERLCEVHQRPDELANVSLLRQGFLGCSPETPSVAFSLDTLELYHRLRRRHGQLSIQTMARVLCDLHDYTYHTCHRDQLNIAFDAYLDILRCVEKMANVALKRDTPHWRVKNACPPCHYELEDEVPLIPRAWYGHDGNFSLKRAADAGTVDGRQFDSSYLLSRADVDVFKDEVKRRAPTQTDSEDGSLDALGEAGDEAGDVTDAQEIKTTCSKTWKAAASENKKGAFEIYETNGVFPVACRHGLVITFAEIVRSGELAKYPLATTNFLLEVFGDDLGLGADIGCALTETIKQSKLLGEKAAKARLQVIVNAFHGWAHNRLCQLKYHPLYRKGTGLEDLEILERIFSSSNTIARPIRHATKFHWLQAVDLHFRQWDEQKYQELSTFIYNNYKQALVIIRDYTPQIAAFKAQFMVGDADIEGWLAAELKFLQELKDEPEERVLAVVYVDALILLRKSDEKWNRVSNMFTNTNFHDVTNYGANTRATARLEADRRAAMDQQLVAIRAVNDLEAKLGITTRWTPAHLEYRDTINYMRQRDYHRALDSIQQLVVQRLFELSKANMSGLGYKLRDSIWRALKVRSKAIQSALDRYNAVAPLMQPPAPILDWKQILDYTFISEFELLKYSRSHQDITIQAWSRPIYREAVAKYYKLRAAHEEITRVNVEARRLRTAIHDEHLHYEDCITELGPSDPQLAAELRSRYATRRRVNALHGRKLDMLESLAGFTGIRGVGTRRGGSSAREGRSDTPDSDDMARAFMTAADCDQRATVDGDLYAEGDTAPHGEDSIADGEDDEEVTALAVSMSEAVVNESPPVVPSLIGNTCLAVTHHSTALILPCSRLRWLRHLDDRVNMFTPQATPRTSGRHAHQRRPLTTRAAYSPPSMRNWVSQRNPEPLQADIAAERYRRRFAVSRDQREYPAAAGQNFLHPHFLLNSEERRWAWHEGLCDIQDAVTGMGRLADVVHIGFTLRPEWDPSKPVNVDNIEVVTTISRQVEQMEGWKEIIDRLADMVRREIGVQHILQFRTKLSQVTPPPGYTFDDTTRNSIHTPLQVAPETQRLASLPQLVPRPAEHAAPDTTPSRPSTNTQQDSSTSSGAATIVSSIAGPSCRAGQNSGLPADATDAVITPCTGRSSRRIHRDSSWSEGEDAAAARRVVPVLRPYRSIQRDSSRSNDSAASISVPHVIRSGSIVISTTDEEDSENASDANPFAAENVQRAVPAPSRPNWLHTPLGSPPDHSPIGQRGSRNQHPVQPPPSYYTHPSINTFGFPEPVIRFLRNSGHVNARALCIIDTTRSCDVSCWRGRFREAGLSSSQAKELQDLLLASLPMELRRALDAASLPEGDVDHYWLGLEDSSDGL